jgi:hypothetical protein
MEAATVPSVEMVRMKGREGEGCAGLREHRMETVQPSGHLQGQQAGMEQPLGAQPTPYPSCQSWFEAWFLGLGPSVT